MRLTSFLLGLLLSLPAFAADTDAVLEVTAQGRLCGPLGCSISGSYRQGCAVCIGHKGKIYYYLSCGHLFIGEPGCVSVSGTDVVKISYSGVNDWSLITSVKVAECVPISDSNSQSGEQVKLIGWGGGRQHVTTAVATSGDDGRSETPVIGGDSGGAVLNAQGELCGIIVRSDRNTGVTWTPITLIKDALAKRGLTVPVCDCDDDDDGGCDPGNAPPDWQPAPDPRPTPAPLPQPPGVDPEVSILRQEIETLKAQLQILSIKITTAGIKGETGSAGRDGEKGATGEKGEPGPPGQARTVTVIFQDSTGKQLAAPVVIPPDKSVVKVPIERFVSP